MAVYVDDGFCGPPKSWGKWTGGGHLQADTVEELIEFAVDQLGLNSAWLQEGSRPEAIHFDLTESKRKLAIEKGAIAETWREASRRRHK